jgi:hypothetical protein
VSTHNNQLEISTDNEGRVLAMVRSENERDIGAFISDPVAHIYAVADAAGLEVTVVDNRPTDTSTDGVDESGSGS